MTDAKACSPCKVEVLRCLRKDFYYDKEISTIKIRESGRRHISLSADNVDHVRLLIREHCFVGFAGSYMRAATLRTLLASISHDANMEEKALESLKSYTDLMKNYESLRHNFSNLLLAIITALIAFGEKATVGWVAVWLLVASIGLLGAVMTTIQTREVMFFDMQRDIFLQIYLEDRQKHDLKGNHPSLNLFDVYNFVRVCHHTDFSFPRLLASFTNLSAVYGDPLYRKIYSDHFYVVLFTFIFAAGMIGALLAGVSA